MTTHHAGLGPEEDGMSETRTEETRCANPYCFRGVVWSVDGERPCRECRSTVRDNHTPTEHADD